MAVYDPKNHLAGVDWQMREAFAELANRFTTQTGMPLTVRSGARSCAQQNELYGIGRTYNLGSKPVTYARGCQSWHVLGRAIDADPADPSTGKPTSATQSCANATIAGQLWEQMGGVWGGRFGGFGSCGDQGHFEWHAGRKLVELCPDPDRCGEATLAIATMKPSVPWAWSLAGGVLVLGIGLFLIGPKRR